MSKAKAIPPLNEKALRRFWSKVALPDANGCMLWLNHKSSSGYGRFQLEGASHSAPRISLVLAVGAPSSPTVEAAHRPRVCRRRDCVAPEHLRWATRTENVYDMGIDGTTPRGRSHGKAKLTEDQVWEIRTAFALGGISHTALGARYGVSRRLICNVVRRDFWTHVQPDGRD